MLICLQECGITGRKYTYDKVRMLARRFGSSLVRMGFKKGEVLGLVLPNLPEFPITLLGAAGVGMPVTTVNPIYTAEEIARQMQNSGTSVIVTIPQMADTIRQVASMCPEVRRLIVVGGPEEGFVSLLEMFQDSGDLFDDNIEVLHFPCLPGECCINCFFFHRLISLKTSLSCPIQGNFIKFFPHYILTE